MPWLLLHVHPVILIKISDLYKIESYINQKIFKVHDQIPLNPLILIKSI